MFAPMMMRSSLVDDSDDAAIFGCNIGSVYSIVHGNLQKRSDVRCWVGVNVLCCALCVRPFCNANTSEVRHCFSSLLGLGFRAVVGMLVRIV
jgi:hypothetical protein